MNYEFREWAENGSTICTDPEYTFIVDTNRNFTAYFDYLFDIEEVNLNTFKIYPVPSKGMISLSFNSKEIFIDELALMNLSGEYILRKSIGEAGSRSIDLTGNPRGVYLLQLLFNGKVIGCKKIVLH
jgi:hypothetical protein